MTTLSEMRTRVQYAMGVTSTSERGIDGPSIDEHIRRAVEEFSLYVPIRSTADLTVAGGTRTLALSVLTRPIRVRAVEYPIGSWPRTLLDFDAWGNTLTLDHTPPVTAYTVRAYVEQAHLVDSVGSTLEPEHEVVVVEGATAIAILARAMGAANAAESSTAPPQTYQHVNIAQARLTRWHAMLRRLSARPVVRFAVTPAAAPTKRDTVTWG